MVAPTRRHVAGPRIEGAQEPCIGSCGGGYKPHARDEASKVKKEM